MTPIKLLREVADFGQIEAESDELLRESFSDHPALAAVVKDRKFLVLGRKGSGKTAIYQTLLDLANHNRFVTGFSFVDYPWQFHDKLKSDDAVDQERYPHSWKYLLLLSVAKTVVNVDQSWSEAAVEAKEELRRFLVDTYGGTNPSLSETFAPTATQGFLERLTFDFKIVKLNAAVAKPNAAAYFQEFNRSLEQVVLSALNPSHQYLVCFDELDRGFDPNNEQYRQRIIGLLLASRDLARSSQQVGKGFKPIVFLRSDIFASLSFEDKNKMADTYATSIEWEYANGPTLKGLMERRIAARLGADPKSAWDLAFDVTQEMRGRQSKYAYIVSHTLRRPRDIIKFCNCILDTFRTRNPSENDRFTNEDVNSGRKEYSKYFRHELEDEAYRYIPDFKIVLEILRHAGQQVIERQQLEEAYKVWQGKMQPATDLDKLLLVLYDLSIVGFKRVGGSGGGSAFIFKYTDPDSECNTKSSEFKIHSGLVDTLGIKRYSRASEEEMLLRMFE